MSEDKPRALVLPWTDDAVDQALAAALEKAGFVVQRGGAFDATAARLVLRGDAALDAVHLDAGPPITWIAPAWRDRRVSAAIQRLGGLVVFGSSDPAFDPRLSSAMEEAGVRIRAIRRVDARFCHPSEAAPRAEVLAELAAILA